MNEETNSECEAPSAKRFKLDESDSLPDESRTEPGEFADSKYDNFVTPEELEKLKEFQVLDEVKSNDEDSNDEDSESSDGKSEGLPEDEIEKMLEEDLPDGFKGAPKQKERPYITRQKIVLEEKGVNHFEVLPLDWMMVRHYSGMLVYMHRATRVCTLSKPYFLGKGNTRRHDIPISAIPCYSYRRALEEEVKQKEIDRKIEEQIKNGTWVTNGQTTDKGASEKLVTDKIAAEKNVPDKIPSENIVVDKIAAEKMVADKMAAENMVTEEMATDKEDSLNKDSDKTSEIKPDFEVAPMKCPFRRRVNGNDADSGPNNVDMKEVQNADENNETGNMDVTENGVAENGIGENGVDENGVDENGVDENGVDNGVAENGEANKDVEIPLNRQPVVLPGGIVMPPPRVETVNTSWKTQHLTHEQVNGYCKKLFRFKTVNIMHFKRWADRRKYTRARKTLQYPTLPEGTKLITIPAQPSNGAENGGKSNKRDWVMNMNGRSYLSVFHEYVRRALQKQPVYEFVQLENASTPYQATVYIGGMQYGVGHGSSKRQAKSAAARASIHILIPEMRDELDAHAPPAAAAAAEPDFSFFDYVSIEDPRITEFCAATCEPSPHAILRTCLLRNFGAGDRHIQTEMKKLEYQKIELTMKVGKHTATVVCKNKKTAKQRASQAILQALHPHVRSWGSLLRLYGSRSVKSCKEKKLEEQQITLLQDKARHNEPNHAVLAKLRAEMDKLRARDAAVVPIGTLSLRATLPTHSGANLNNVDL